MRMRCSGMRLAAALAAAALAAPLAASGQVRPARTMGPDIPDCRADRTVEVCRAERAFTPEELTGRLGSSHTAVWVDGDVLVAAARRPGVESVSLCCAIQAPMRRLGETDLWTLAARLSNIESAFVDVMARPEPSRLPLQWRGPNAPKPPPSVPFESLARTEHVIDSASLGQKRKLTVWLPPRYSKAGSYPVVYSADGASVLSIASVVLPMIEAGTLPPLIMVGLENGEGMARYEEYVSGRFEAHEAFVLKEVLPFIEANYAVSKNRSGRLLIGQSNGADWALQTGARNPEVFGHIVALSPAAWDGSGLERPGRPRVFVAAGLYEGQMLYMARQVEAKARQTAGDLVLKTMASGHSGILWSQLYPEALSWAFGRPAGEAR